MLPPLLLVIYSIVTVGHFVATGRWLRMSGVPMSREHLWLHTMAIGLGSLSAVLHFLVFLNSLTLTAGIALISVVHLLAAVIVRLQPSGIRVSLPDEREGLFPAVGSMAIIVALVLQWFDASARSLGINGTDAAHYHVPHALNFALGAGPLGLLATPHRYPMGTSVLAAWLIIPVGDGQLIDLAMVPYFLLAAAALAVLFRTVTGEPSVVWLPWLLLVLLTSPLLRGSVLMSADLPYAAAFLGVLALLLDIRNRRQLHVCDGLSTTALLGLLVGSKITGVFSATLFLPLAISAVVAAGLRGIFRSTTRAQIAQLLGLGAIFLASGGVWLVRNWLRFGLGAPAPVLVMLGLQEGRTAGFASRYYRSVLRDMRDVVDYDIVGRFMHYARIWFGDWFLPCGILLIVLASDVALQLIRHRRLGTFTKRKLELAALFGFLAGAHIFVLVGSPWTSLEWSSGLSLRFLLPFAFLYPFVAFVALFPESLPWHRVILVRGAIWTLLVSSSGFAFLHAGYGSTRLGHTSFPLLAVPVLLPALLLAAGLYADRFDHYNRIIGRAALWTMTSLVVLFGLCSSAHHSRLVAKENEIYEGRVRASSEARVTEQRNLFFQIERYDRSRDVPCSEKRFFLAGRFDLPLALQPPLWRNLVFDLTAHRRRNGFPSGQRPGEGRCDYIIAKKPKKRQITPQGSLSDRFGFTGELEPAGEYGRYRAFAIR